MTKRNYYLVHFTCKLRDREAFTGSTEANVLVHDPKNIVADLEAFIAERVRKQRPELKFDKLEIASVFLLHTETVEETQPAAPQAPDNLVTAVRAYLAALDEFNQLNSLKTTAWSSQKRGTMQQILQAGMELHGRRRLLESLLQSAGGEYNEKI